MKKVAVFFLMFCFPFLVSAEVDYTLENVLIDAEVLRNGDMHVKELIVLDGTFHGYIRDITYKNSKLDFHTPTNFEQDAIYNAHGIKNMKIYAKKVESNVNYETFQEEFTYLEEASSSLNSTHNVYQESMLPNGYSYKMYYPGDDEKIAFYLDYTVKDVVVVYEDVAELYWTFIGDGFDDKIKNLQIRVQLPESDDSMRLWAHGDLTGDIQKLNDQTVEATAKKLLPNSPVDIRLVFNRDMLLSCAKGAPITALEGILEVELARAEKANEIRRKAKSLNITISVISGIFGVSILGYFVYAKKKYYSKIKPEFQLEYNREFIDDYNVEVVDYLMKKSVSENAFSASILNLVYKKNLKVEEISSEKGKKKNYQFTLIHRENLNRSEEKLIQFLFERVGKGDTFTTKDLERYASSTKTYVTFQNTYTAWKKCVEEDGKKELFYADYKEPVVVSLLFLLFAVLLCFLNMGLNVFSVFPWICLLFAVIFIFYCAFQNPKTKKGAEHYAKWKAFKKFLEDFGDFRAKELPEIALWERYLVYATVFGIADKVEKAMSVKIKELGITSSSVYYPTWVDYSFANSLSRSVNQSFVSNRATYSRVASSNFSSGSGGGGGFSSGGGFGGGGGGGRGF